MIIKLTLPGAPRTKKNSQRIIEKKNKKPAVLPSKAFSKYEVKCLNYLRRCELPKDLLPIREPVNLCAIYYRDTTGIVDLVGLLQATNDILVDAGILADDNSNIVASHDGSRVMFDKQKPRAEITISLYKPSLNDTNQH